MAASVKVGSFLTGTGAATSTVSVTGIGGAPKGVLFFMASGLSDANDGSKGDIFPTFGAMDDAGNQFCLSGEDEHDVGTSDTDHRFTASDCMYMLDSAGGLYGSFKYKSMDADGFTVEISDAFAATKRVYYIAFLGMTNFRVGYDTTKTSTGTKATSIGFRPTAGLLFGSGCSNLDTVLDSMRISVGAFGGPSSEGVAAIGCENGAGTSDAGRYFYDGECLAVLNTDPNSLMIRAELSSLDAGGFTLNYLETDATARYFGYVAMDGILFDMNVWTSPNNSSSTSISGRGFQPIGLVCIGSYRAAQVEDLDSQDTSSSQGVLNFGAADATPSYVSMCVSSGDNLATTANVRSQRVDAFACSHSTPSSIYSLRYRTDLDSYDAGGVTIDVISNSDSDTPQFLVFLMRATVANSQSVAGVLSSAGALVNKAKKALAGALTSAGALLADFISGGELYLQALAGALGSTGVVSIKAKKVLAGALTSAGAVLGHVYLWHVALAGAVATAGEVSRKTAKALAGAVATAGALAKKALKALAGSLGLSGALETLLTEAPVVYKQAVGGVLSFVGGMVRWRTKILGNIFGMKATGIVHGEEHVKLLQGLRHVSRLHGEEHVKRVHGPKDDDTIHSGG